MLEIGAQFKPISKWLLHGKMSDLRIIVRWMASCVVCEGEELLKAVTMSERVRDGEIAQK